jgi:hypothetical protein
VISDNSQGNPLLILLDLTVTQRQLDNLGYLTVQEKEQVEWARAPFLLNVEEFAYHAVSGGDDIETVLKKIDFGLDEIMTEAEAVALEGMDVDDFSFLKEALHQAVDRQWRMTPFRRYLGYLNRRPKILFIPLGLIVIGFVIYSILAGSPK